MTLVYSFDSSGAGAQIGSAYVGPSPKQTTISASNSAALVGGPCSQVIGKLRLGVQGQHGKDLSSTQPVSPLAAHAQTADGDTYLLSRGDTMNTRLFQTIKAAGLATLVLGCLPTITLAIPANQRDVELDTVQTSSTSFVLVPPTSVTVNNGDIARNCIIQFSANASASQVNEGVDIAFAIGTATVGAGACNTSGGPDFFYVQSSAPDAASATVMHVRNVPSGTRTIKACFRLFDPGIDGGIAQLATRAMTVECRTQ
jgi:hypothetical protein